MKLKRQEFLGLKQGGMSVTEYRDKYIELSRYALANIADNEDKQDHFRNGLSGAIKYQPLCHTFASFQELVDNAIKVEHAHKEMGEMKRKMDLQGQSSNNRPRFASPQGAPFRSRGQNVNYGQNQYQNQQTPQTPRTGQHAPCSNFPQNHQNTPTNTPMRNPNSAPVGKDTCYRCGEIGQYANNCPKRNDQNTPGQFNDSAQRQTPQ